MVLLRDFDFGRINFIIALRERERERERVCGDCGPVWRDGVREGGGKIHTFRQSVARVGWEGWRVAEIRRV